MVARVPPSNIALSGPSLAVPTASLEQRLAAIESRLAVLEKLFNVQNDGSVTMKTAKFAIDALSVSVKAAQSMTLTSGGPADLKASSSMSLHAGGSASLKGATLSFNGGTKPLARVGDPVQITGVQQQGAAFPNAQILNGSTSILG